MPLSHNPKPIIVNFPEPVKVIFTIAGFGVATAIVPQKSRVATYVVAGILGGALGAAYLDYIFSFSYNYLKDDKYGKLKGDIEGALVGASIVMGLSALRDDKLSNAQKIIIAGGIGSLLGHSSVYAGFFGSQHDWVNSIGAISGAVVGGGLYFVANKMITKK